MAGNWFGSDGSEDESDPMADSMIDKNKLSKSEKSLKKPLQMFQEEQKQSATGNQNIPRVNGQDRQAAHDHEMNGNHILNSDATRT